MIVKFKNVYGNYIFFFKKNKNELLLNIEFILFEFIFFRWIYSCRLLIVLIKWILLVLKIEYGIIMGWELCYFSWKKVRNFFS